LTKDIPTLERALHIKTVSVSMKSSGYTASAKCCPSFSGIRYTTSLYPLNKNTDLPDSKQMLFMRVLWLWGKTEK